MTTQATPSEHRDYQRRLADAGIIPPRAATRPVYCYACGERFDPGSEGVHRWQIEGRVLWVATCPNPHCKSTITTHERTDD